MKPVQLKPTCQVIEETNRTGVKFVLTSLRIAQTFLDLADATESAARLHFLANARSTCETVLRLLSKLHPTEPEQVVLQSKLEELKHRLRVSDEYVPNGTARSSGSPVGFFDPSGYLGMN